jgi:hypothetical protein
MPTVDDMDPRPALIGCLAFAIALASCSFAPNNNANGHDMGADNHDGGGGSGGGSGGSDLGFYGCATAGLNLSFQWSAGTPPVLGRITAIATASEYGIPKWRIELGSKVLSPTAGQGTLTAQLDVTEPGEYWFYFDNGFDCSVSAPYSVNAADGIPATYTFRVSPPVGAGAPMKDFSETIHGGTQPGLRILALDPGIPISSVLTTASAQPVAGEVRFIATSGPDAIATASRAAPVGQFTLFVSAAAHYRPLLIPFDQTLAPMIFATDDSGMNLANLVTTSKSSPFVVDAGATVSGSVTGTSGPLQANVVLHAGPVPSSVGTTLADGSFTLHAQPMAGPFDVEVSALGWPTVTLPGVSVPAAGASLQIAYATPRFTVGGSVASSKGTPLVGAHVTIQSRAGHDLANVATIAVGGNAAVAVAGRVNQVVTTLAGGALPPMALPAGDYDLLIDPAGATPASSGDGLTFAQATVNGAATWSLKLAPKVMLMGTVVDSATPPQPVAGAKIVAVESGGFAPAFTTSSSSDPAQLGRFSLLVDSGVGIDLMVDPPAASHGLANADVHLPRGTTSTTVVLDPGFAVPAKVTLNGSAIRGALVQVLAPDGSAPAPSRVTDSSGRVTVYVPDPGELDVDGGISHRQ